MEQKKAINFPIAGKIQHGLKQKENKPKELGYFIAKTQNNEMNFLMNRFKEKYPKETKVNISFFDENPLTIRNVRYNQSGAVCYCLENETKGKEKTKNGWKQIECKKDCKYRITDTPGKPMCNREGTLKFIIPNVTTDRIFLMKITGQTSINRIKDYISLQKMQGKSIVGDYILSLHQEEQTNKEGKKFKNFILDIYKNDELISNNNIFPNNEKIIENNVKEQANETLKKSTTIKKELKTLIQNKSETTKKVEKSTEQKDIDVNKISDDELQKCFTLISTKRESILNNNVPKEYLIGSFVNIKDEELDIIIPPEFAEGLEKCNLGTTVKLDISKSKNNRIFAKTLEYITKLEKM